VNKYDFSLFSFSIPQVIFSLCVKKKNYLTQKYQRVHFLNRTRVVNELSVGGVKKTSELNLDSTSAFGFSMHTRLLGDSQCLCLHAVLSLLLII